MCVRRCHGRQLGLGSRRRNDALNRSLILMTTTVSGPILNTSLTLLLRFAETVTHVSVPRARRIFTRRSKELLQGNVKRLTNLFERLGHAFDDSTLDF